MRVDHLSNCILCLPEIAIVLRVDLLHSHPFLRHLQRCFLHFYFFLFYFLFHVLQRERIMSKYRNKQNRGVKQENRENRPYGSVS